MAPLRAHLLPASAEGLAAAARLLRLRRLVAFPTDTLYALGALALDAGAVAKVFRAKGRGPERALPVLLATAADVHLVAAEFPPLGQALATRFWPGALTIVLRASSELPKSLHGGSGTIAVRVPDHALARELIALAGGPLTGTSANRSGLVPARTSVDVLAQLGGRIHAVVAGASPGGVPSTVVDVTVAPPRVLRVGAIGMAELEALFARAR